MAGGGQFAQGRRDDGEDRDQSDPLVCFALRFLLHAEPEIGYSELFRIADASSWTN